MKNPGDVEQAILRLPKNYCSLDWDDLTKYVSRQFIKDHPEYPWNYKLEKLKPPPYWPEDIIINDNIRLLDIWILPSRDENRLWDILHCRALPAEFIAINQVRHPSGFLKTTYELDNLMIRPEFETWGWDYVHRILLNPGITVAHWSVLKKYVNQEYLERCIPMYAGNMSYPELMQIKDEYPIVKYDFVWKNQELTPAQMIELQKESAGHTDRIRLLDIVKAIDIISLSYMIGNPNITPEFWMLYIVDDYQVEVSTFIFAARYLLKIVPDLIREYITVFPENLSLDYSNAELYLKLITYYY